MRPAPPTKVQNQDKKRLNYCKLWNVIVGRTQVVLVRHGETIWNVEGRFQGHKDSALSENGIAQAMALSGRLARFNFTDLYSSDSGRAYSTAEFISSTRGHPIVTDHRLRERNLGIFEGLRSEEIEVKYPSEYRSYKTSDPDYVIPQGESARQRFYRGVTYIEEVARKHAGGVIVIVTHGGILESLFRRAALMSLDVPRTFKLLNGSLNIFFYEDGRWLLRTWGDVSHLESLRVLDDLHS
jgi:probable phosphoglycerate mutase